MIKHLIVIGILGLLLVGSLVFFVGDKKEESENPSQEDEEVIYQGPVRPGDDEAYFRKTGITRPLEESK